MTHGLPATGQTHWTERLNASIKAVKAATDEAGALAGEIGTGPPEGVVEAEAGTVYADVAATNGAVRWVKGYQSGNTGWKVTHGDTGWRLVVDGTVPGMPTFRTWVRRVNRLVYYTTDETEPSSISGLTGLWTIPLGFRDDTVGGWSMGHVTDHRAAPNAGSSLFTSPTMLGLYASRGQRHVASLAVSTDDPWPRSLPGSADDTLPQD